MIYLHVPFEQKDDAKSMGAKWDPQKKLWYAPDESYKELIQKYSELVPKQTRFTKKEKQEKVDYASEPIKPLVLIGENRRFGGNELYVDILPKGSNISLRRILSESDFSRLRNLLVKRVAYRCECCGEECISSQNKYLEVCELFSFNFSTKIQKLERLTALCKECYKTTRLLDKGIALAHLMDVNGLDKEDAKKHIFDAFDTWKSRCEIKWTLDLSIINNSGLSIQQKKDSEKVIDNENQSQNQNKSTKIVINKIDGNSTAIKSSHKSRDSRESIDNSRDSRNTKKITINKINTHKEQCMFDSD